MHSIAYVIPYFGKLPNYFPLWLLSCKFNPTIDFLIITDDKTEYNYPENVKVTYTTLEETKEKMQKLFDFDISLERAYKLCDYRPAYGEIYEEELKDYDFWGHCDLDQIWGDIRAFYTEDILEKNQKVGFNGHSTLYKNTKENNTRYRLTDSDENDIVSYKEVYTNDKSYGFDEDPMDNIFSEYDLPVFRKIVYANLAKYPKNFSLSWITPEDEYKNEHQIFVWEKGKVKRYFYHNSEVGTDEFMYLHYWCRPTTIKVDKYDDDTRLLIYPDITTDKPFEITPKLVLKKSKGNRIIFLSKALYRNRKKLTPERIMFNIKDSLEKKFGYKYYDQEKYK